MDVTIALTGFLAILAAWAAIGYTERAHERSRFTTTLPGAREQFTDA